MSRMNKVNDKINNLVKIKWIITIKNNMVKSWLVNDLTACSLR